MAHLPWVELMEKEIEDQKSCYFGALPRSEAVNGKKWMRNWNLVDHIMLHFLSQNPLKYVGLIEHQLSLSSQAQLAAWRHHRNRESH